MRPVSVRLFTKACHLVSMSCKTTIKKLFLSTDIKEAIIPQLQRRATEKQDSRHRGTSFSWICLIWHSPIMNPTGARQQRFNIGSDPRGYREQVETQLLCSQRSRCLVDAYHKLLLRALPSLIHHILTESRVETCLVIWLDAQSSLTEALAFRAHPRFILALHISGCDLIQLFNLYPESLPVLKQVTGIDI